MKLFLIFIRSNLFPHPVPISTIFRYNKDENFQAAGPWNKYMVLEVSLDGTKSWFLCFISG